MISILVDAWICIRSAAVDYMGLGGRAKSDLIALFLRYVYLSIIPRYFMKGSFVRDSFFIS